MFIFLDTGFGGLDSWIERRVVDKRLTVQITLHFVLVPAQPHSNGILHVLGPPCGQQRAYQQQLL